MSLSPTSIANAAHYAWGDACDGWRLLDHPSLSVIQERVPAGAGEVLHVHAHARQVFYVLEGRLDFTGEGGSVALGPGECVHVPPGVSHRVTNPSAVAAVFLVISSPSTAGDRTEVR